MKLEDFVKSIIQRVNHVILELSVCDMAFFQNFEHVKFLLKHSYMYHNRKAERGGTRQISKIYRALVTGIISEDKVMLPSALL